MLSFHPVHTMGTFDKLDEVLLRLTNHQLSLSKSMHSLTQKIDELLNRVTPILSSSSSPTPPPSPSVPANNHRMKLDVPRFDGTEPLGWIFKINQFFEYHGTPKNERLTIASFYIEGRALTWFQFILHEPFCPLPYFL